MGIRVGTGIGPVRVSMGGGSGLFVGLFYAMFMMCAYLLYYGFIAIAYVTMWLLKGVVELSDMGWRAWQKRQARLAFEREQQRQYEAGLAWRADQQNAEYLAGGSGLPGDPWSPDDPRWQRPA